MKWFGFLSKQEKKK